MKKYDNFFFFPPPVLTSSTIHIYCTYLDYREKKESHFFIYFIKEGGRYK